jgi:hypothetical protein
MQYKIATYKTRPTRYENESHYARPTVSILQPQLEYRKELQKAILKAPYDRL